MMARSLAGPTAVNYPTSGSLDHRYDRGAQSLRHYIHALTDNEAAVSLRIEKLDGVDRAKAKKVSRDEDERRLAAGEVTALQLKLENSFFGSLSNGKWKMVAIGGRPIVSKPHK